MRAGIVLGLLLGLVGCDASPDDPSCESSDCACGLLDDADPADVPDAEVAFVIEAGADTTQHRWAEAEGDALTCRIVACDPDRQVLEFATASGSDRLELSTCGPIEGAGTRPVVDAAEVSACVDGHSGWSARFTSGEVYESAVGAELCNLHTERRGASLTGSFECSDLRSGAGEVIRLSEGTFACGVEI